jgi:hypothetical protein
MGKEGERLATVVAVDPENKEIMLKLDNWDVLASEMI